MKKPLWTRGRAYRFGFADGVQARPCDEKQMINFSLQMAYLKGYLEGQERVQK